MGDYEKRVAEVLFITASFSSRLKNGEHLETVLVQAFEYDSDSVVEDHSLTDVDEIIISLKSGSVVSYSKSYPTTGLVSARLVLSASDVAAVGIIDPLTVDVSSYALEVDETEATIRALAGSSGSSYTIRFTATTNFGVVLVEEKTIDVVP